ncbi:hypothetical protein JCM16303_002497 [Sporobolomyces ruberrimus]
MAEHAAQEGVPRRRPSISTSSTNSATPSTTLPPPSSHPPPGSKHDNLNFLPEQRPWSTRSIGYQYLPFRGIYHDLKRRAPFYASDWTEGFKPKNYERVVGATIKMFFLNLFPCLAYIIDMYVRTEGAYGVNEGILSSAIAALTFALLSVQPLTIVGVTGLINLFNYTTFDILKGYNVDYLQFQAWVLIWSAITHWITAVLNISDYTRFITDMTSETFGLYVGVIYIQKGIELLVYEFDDGTGQAGWFSVVVAILFALSVYFVERSGTLPFGPFWFRKFLVDYAFAAAVVFYTGFVHIPGYIKSSDIQYLPITKSFAPTVDRNWVVPFWDLSVKWIFVALPFGCLVTLLFYFDNNVSSVMAQSRGFPVKRPAGFHWDFFLLGCTTFVSGILGLPAPNGLVPQAPVHTESLCVTKMVPHSTPLSAGGFFEGSVREAKEKGEKGEGMKVVRTRLVEQRISHFAMGLLIMGCMSRPLLVVFGLMSRAMFAGIFIVVGWGSVEGNGIVHKTLYVLRDSNLIPSDHPLKEIKKSSILKFIGVQWLFFAAIIAISETIAGIGFPVIIILLIPLRHFTLPKYFTPFELSVLDAPTANSAAVLVSIGGPLESEGREGTTKPRRKDEEMGGKTSARFTDEEGAEKEREQGLRRRETREEIERQGGIVGGEEGVQRDMDIHR